MARRRARFLAWFRAVPLGVVLALGAASCVYRYAPALLFKGLYQLEYETYIADACERHGVDPYLVAAIIESESDWVDGAESTKGAMGLMQLMPETAQQMASWGLVDAEAYPYEDLTDPITNIEYGCAFLAYLCDYYDGDVDKVIAAYNAGMGNVNAWLDSDAAFIDAIAFPETQAYLLKVRAAYSRYQDLYPDAFE